MVVQVVGDPPLVHAGQEHGKNAFDYLGGLRVNQKRVFIVWIFHIAIRRVRTDKLTVAALHIEYLPDFL